MINHETHKLHERGTLNTAVAPSACLQNCFPGFSTGGAIDGSPRREPWDRRRSGQAPEGRKKTHMKRSFCLPSGAWNSLPQTHGSRCGLSSAAATQLKQILKTRPSASVVGHVTPYASNFAFPRAAGRGLPALPESLSGNALWRENNFGRSAPILGRSNAALREPLEKLGAIACCTVLWSRTATLQKQIFQSGSESQAFRVFSVFRGSTQSGFYV